MLFKVIRESIEECALDAIAGRFGLAAWITGSCGKAWGGEVLRITVRIGHVGF